MQFQTLVNGCDPYIKEELDKLVLLKKGQNGTLNFATLNTFIESEVDRLHSVARTIMEHKDKGSTMLDEIFTFALETMWEIKL